MMYYLWNLV